MLTDKTGAVAHLGLARLAATLIFLLASCGGGMSYSELSSDPNSGGASLANRAVKVSYFDADGQTGSFGIPDGIRGSITAGERISSVICVTCRVSALPPMGYSQVKAMMRTAPMSGLKLNEQQLADLTAWLNRDAIPPPGTK